jgi:hypothetical protein
MSVFVPSSRRRFLCKLVLHIAQNEAIAAAFLDIKTGNTASAANGEASERTGIESTGHPREIAGSANPTLVQ